MVNINAEERLILALDTGDKKEFVSMLDRLSGAIKWVKIGAYPFTKFGPQSVEWAKNRGYKVFLDMKFHDIPNTVSNAVRVSFDMGVDMLTIHTMGGFAMMEAAAKEAWNSENQPIVLGVTVLTSLDNAFLKETLGASRTLEEEVEFLANIAKSAGLSGVVSSPNEASLIRKTCGDDFIIVTPGIRLEGDSSDDQKRIATPESALKNGADYIVVGRSITKSDNPIKTVETIIERIKSVYG